MRREKFTISFEFVWILFWASALLVIWGGLGKALVWTWAPSDVMVYASQVLFFPVWLILMHEIVARRSGGYVFWLIVMVLFPHFAALVYLLRREKMIRFFS